MYADIKGAIWGAVPFDGDATQILIGWTIYMIAILGFRRTIKRWSAPLPVLVLGLAIEIADMVLLGQSFAWSARDLLLFSLLPVLTTFFYRIGWAK